MVQSTSVKLKPLIDELPVVVLASIVRVSCDHGCADFVAREDYARLETLKSLTLPAGCSFSPYQEQIKKQTCVFEGFRYSRCGYPDMTTLTVKNKTPGEAAATQRKQMAGYCSVR